MKTDFPKITVVTVTYNAEQYLEQTIKSVIEQDYPNIEYIIIDGASTDGTIDIIKKYEKYLSYWISEPDKGIYDAMNKGIDVATGEWINFMNAGDSLYDNQSISSFIKDLHKNTEIYCGGIYLYDTKTTNSIFFPPKGVDTIFQVMPCWHQSTFIKSNIMKYYKYFTLFKLSSDYDFFMRCYLDNIKFQFSKNPISIMLTGGAHQQFSELAYLESLMILSYHNQSFENIFENIYFQNLSKQFSSKNTNLTFSKLFNTFEDTLEELNLENKRFILYGFGKIGKLIYTKYKNSIIKVVDKDFEKLSQKENIDIFSPDILKEYKNDFILISVLGREKEITSSLLNLGIEKAKIRIIEI